MTYKTEHFEGEETDYWDKVVESALVSGKSLDSVKLLRVMVARIKHKEQVIERKSKRIKQLKNELKGVYEELDELTVQVFGSKDE